MKEGANVLEFLEYDFAHYGNPFPHWKLASLTNLNYFYLFGVLFQRRMRQSYYEIKLKVTWKYVIQFSH